MNFTHRATNSSRHRRRLRDEKARQEREAKERQERKAREKSEAEMEDVKRESVEEITDSLDGLKEEMLGFIETQNENVIPWDGVLVEKMVQHLDSLKAALLRAPSKVESARLESFYKAKAPTLTDLNAKLQGWAKKVKIKVRSNKTLEATTDSYSKVMVLVSLDDPISNRLSEGDDDIDKVNFYVLDSAMKELAWRMNR